MARLGLTPAQGPHAAQPKQQQQQQKKKKKKNAGKKGSGTCDSGLDDDEWFNRYGEEGTEEGAEGSCGGISTGKHTASPSSGLTECNHCDINVIFHICKGLQHLVQTLLQTNFRFTQGKVFTFIYDSVMQL
jgi:hypothetical protein